MAIVAPASAFARDEFDRGVQEIERLGFVPVFDDSVFARAAGYLAGAAESRAASFMKHWTDPDVAALVAVPLTLGRTSEPAVVAGLPAVPAEEKGADADIAAYTGIDDGRSSGDDSRNPFIAPNGINKPKDPNAEQTPSGKDVPETPASGGSSGGGGYDVPSGSVPGLMARTSCRFWRSWTDRGRTPGPRQPGQGSGIGRRAFCETENGSPRFRTAPAASAFRSGVWTYLERSCRRGLYVFPADARLLDARPRFPIEVVVAFTGWLG